MRFIIFSVILTIHANVFANNSVGPRLPSSWIQEKYDLMLKLVSEITVERPKHDLFQVITTIELSAKRPRPMRRNETNTQDTSKTRLKCYYEKSNFIILEVSKNLKFLNREHDFTDVDIGDVFNWSDIKCEIIG